MNRRALRLLVLLTTFGGCTRIAPVQVPPEVLRNYQGGGTSHNRYVVRMTDGERDWEFQLPELATAYEVRVPLKGRPGAPLSVDQGGLTAADRELIEARAATSPTEDERRARGGDELEQGGDQDEGAPGRRDTKASGRGQGGSPARTEKVAQRGSYLLTMNKVKELYRTRHYELALVEVVALEQQYPEDERILSMKGSLYDKMGNKQLARESWERALRINPYNLAVMEALQRLGK